MKKFALAAIAGATLAFVAPQAANAQDAWPVEPGDYVEMSMIKVDDGHSLEYATYLADQYRKSQDFAKSQGWIDGYQIWVNQYPREGEPDVYLITWFPHFVDNDEGKARAKAYQDYMKMTVQDMQAGSAKRSEYRHAAGDMLFRVMKWKAK
ncbi:hypothetical protein [Tsuneonella mangrovi]|uniref:hypothetical protein n=1 Tax=Tsuneonella mangrovi TaxID=1982042 RepID=UPI001F0B111A|nr:hypothetical protein [Tsuneonella mangrovi]